MSLKQLAANRRNARQSTGPKTATGKAVSKWNALKHGILSTQVLVRGQHGRESAREFTALHRRFTAELRPVGPLEEMLVDQVVTAHWRRRRALTAEAGEIALSVDGGHWERERGLGPRLQWLCWRTRGDAVEAMQESDLGNSVLEAWLGEIREAVARDGELTEATVHNLVQKTGTAASWPARELEQLRQRQAENPEGLDAVALRERNRKAALAFADRELGMVAWRRRKCRQHEADAETAHQAAAALPSLAALEKILRYETKLERQMFRAMHQLERLQRLRQGEALPAPLTLEVTGKEAE